MNEISLQATQFFPRFLSVVALLSLTWLVAKIAQDLILRTVSKCKFGEPQQGITRTIANFAFWATILIMLPFIIGATGLSTSWIATMQKYIGQVFVNWPIWMLLSLLIAGFSFVVSGVPKFFGQQKNSHGASHRGEIQS